MKLIYTVIIYIYIFLIRLAAFFNEKAKYSVKGRKNWRDSLAKIINPEISYIWFHCSSLGEFEQGRPVIEEIRKKYPGYNTILTFFSPSGYEIRKNYSGADIVMYMPFDTKKNSRKFIESVMPEKAFFIKYDFWYFFISELKKHNIPTYLISGIFREKHIFFQNTPWGRWLRKILLNFEHLFVQDQNSAALLEKNGITNVTVSGDTRFDRVGKIARNSKDFPVIEKFAEGFPVIVAGSTWKPDEELLSEFINNHGNIKIIFVPHEVFPANIIRLQRMIKQPSLKFSESGEENISNYKVLIIDSVGILSSLYKYGSLAYIGGGFGAGIHNILEAATFGLPVIFGPKYEKFKEAIDLKNLGGAFPVRNYIELEASVKKLLDNKEELTKASKICTNFVENNMGSTNIIMKKVFAN
jgi:3-deoxy-D-manno-octulosonic-acid transferase